MNFREQRDRRTAWALRAITFSGASLALVFALVLVVRSWPLWRFSSITHTLFSTAWFPARQQFGFAAYIVGTLSVTALAAIIAVPLSILCALYLSEFAHTRLRAMVVPVFDILASIPSVVFGIWGILCIVPLMRAMAMLQGSARSGYCLLSAAIVLALMIIPTMDIREASLALWATRWETTARVLLRRARAGLLAASLLGISRALGETMAVMMVAGNVARIPNSLFAPVYTLPSLIANNYGEMMSIPAYDAALMCAALLLLIVVALISCGAYVILYHFERGAA
ncbi:MAG: phosphate ABC transporter permease subunit PstC [bacterium]|nr:phosphate ABC transporter permease subunit PstC [bacterium]